MGSGFKNYGNSEETVSLTALYNDVENGDNKTEIAKTGLAPGNEGFRLLITLEEMTSTSQADDALLHMRHKGSAFSPASKANVEMTGQHMLTIQNDPEESLLLNINKPLCH